MGDLRDALARNQVKLPDLAGPLELFAGDRLLRANRRLSVALDGIYHRGEVYMRWLQRLSSLAFGTRLGRFLTQYVALPFGGAFVILKGVDHLAEMLSKLGPVFSAEEQPEEPAGAAVAAGGAAIESDADTNAAAGSDASDPRSEMAAAAPDEQEGAGDAAEGIGQALSEPGEAIAAALIKADPAEAEAGTAATEGEAAEVAEAGTAVPAADDVAEAWEDADLYATTAAPGGEAAGAHHKPFLIPDAAFPFVLIVTGILLMGLIHAPRFRRLVVQLFRGAYRVVKGFLVDFPNWFLNLGVVRRVLESRTFQAVWRAFVKPVLPAVLTWTGLRLAGLQATDALICSAMVFAAIGLFLNLRVGRDLEEIATDRLVHTWRLIRVNIIAGLFRLVMDFFNRLLEVVDRLLYTVDEWLRFRGGEGGGVARR